MIPPLALRTESNDVEWQRFIEALSPPLTPSLSLSDSGSISSSLSLSLSSMSPSLCFYGGIIISLSHPLLFRLERNNKFQDHADAAFLHLKLILWTRQKLCTETHKTTKIVAYSCSAYFFFFFETLITVYLFSFFRETLSLVGEAGFVVLLLES